MGLRLVGGICWGGLRMRWMLGGCGMRWMRGREGRLGVEGGTLGERLRVMVEEWAVSEEEGGEGGEWF